MTITQPLTAQHISRRTGIARDTCSYVLEKFVLKGLAFCLNPDARNGRVYWTTTLAQDCQDRFQSEFSEKRMDLPSVDWALYGWLCFRHRAAIMRILTEPMQPSGMKRRLRIRAPQVKISANNIRDLMQLFLSRNIVQKVFVRKKAHPRYELTEIGQKFRELLVAAEVSR